MDNNRVQLDSIIDIAATLADRAEDLDQVLILYRNKHTGQFGSLDNQLELRDCMWLIETLKFWMMACATGLVVEADGGD